MQSLPIRCFPSPEHPLISFLSWRFTHSGHSVYMESHRQQPSVSGFFYLACFQGLSTLSLCIGASFLSIAKSYFTAWTPHILFIHSPINRHLGCSHLRAIMLLWTFMHKCLCGRKFSGLLGMHLAVELGHHLVLCHFDSSHPRGCKEVSRDFECICLMSNDVRHLFMYLWVICMPFWEKSLVFR